MDDLKQAKQSAQVIALMHGRPAYVYRKRNGEIVIRLVKSSRTWLEREPVELVAVVGAKPKKKRKSL